MNINDIKDYIIKKYPECCLAYNIQNHDYSEEELIKYCEDFFYYEKLKWCGCGEPEIAKKVIRDYLKILYDHKQELKHKSSNYNWLKDWEKRDKELQERFGVKSIYDNELLLCFAYAMDGAEFTEHGSSIGGAWITKEGEMFLWLLGHNEELNEE